MIRILHIVGTMNRGGQETFIMNIYRKINREQVQFDFVVTTPDECDYEKEIVSLGGKVFHITSKTENVINFYRSLYNIVKKGRYKIVHRHTCNASVFGDLIACKLGGTNKAIAHAHNNKDRNMIINFLCRPILSIIADCKLACSHEAGMFVFGNNKFKVIKNGIDYNKFAFDLDTRKEMRKGLGIETSYIIGHVGRFAEQKNHTFILKVFNEILKGIPDAILILVGTGKLENGIKQQAKIMKINKNIKFLGDRSDVNLLMQAFDALIFPSLYEGLGIVLIEAQVACLPCVVSDVIVDGAVITPLVHKLSLAADLDIWKYKLLEVLHSERKIMDREYFEKSGFSIDSVVKQIINLYLE